MLKREANGTTLALRGMRDKSRWRDMRTNRVMARRVRGAAQDMRAFDPANQPTKIAARCQRARSALWRERGYATASVHDVAAIVARARARRVDKVSNARNRGAMRREERFYARRDMSLR